MERSGRCGNLSYASPENMHDCTAGPFESINFLSDWLVPCSCQTPCVVRSNSGRRIDTLHEVVRRRQTNRLGSQARSVGS